MGKQTNDTDKELAAISVILRALESMDGESVQRVLDYVFGRLSIAVPSRIKPVTTIGSAQPSSTVDLAHRPRRPSIRDLKDEKNPDSSNQMAALVAYYLSEVTEEDGERKDYVDTTDIEKYFKQAGFKLPKSLSQTLPNAAAAGYFDSMGRGHYRLNAVGYNLVVHGLPRNNASEVAFKRRRKNKAATQSTRAR